MTLYTLYNISQLVLRADQHIINSLAQTVVAQNYEYERSSKTT